MSPTLTFRTAFWPACTDACLQVADYAAWAIQRSWEQGNDRSHGLIASKILSEFNIYARGRTEYY